MVKGAVVAEDGPEGIDAAAGQGDDGWDVLAALGSLLLVVVAVFVAFADAAGPD